MQGTAAIRASLQEGVVVSVKASVGHQEPMPPEDLAAFAVSQGIAIDAWTRQMRAAKLRFIP
ncbi:MAG: hypothetical protein H6840_12825 [Planctomycetes bacterium]|nr:hypothetical protein [Planctomycetota bacterium]